LISGPISEIVWGYSDQIRAIDVLTEQPEWDGRTVAVFGISQGGFQAIAAAGLDPRVTFFAAGE
jgi:cephalosporin-C deacetylase